MGDSKQIRGARSNAGDIDELPDLSIYYSFTFNQIASIMNQYMKGLF